MSDPNQKDPANPTQPGQQQGKWDPSHKRQPGQDASRDKDKHNKDDQNSAESKSRDVQNRADQSRASQNPQRDPDDEDASTPAKDRGDSSRQKDTKPL